VNDHIASERIIAWVDGRLDGDDADKVRLHLEACAECRRAAEAVEALSDAVEEAAPPIDRLPDATIPPALADRLTRSARNLCAGPPRKRSLRPVVWPLVAIAASIAIVLTVFFLPEKRQISLDVVKLDPSEIDVTTYRGTPSDQYYLDIVLPERGFFCVFDLDRAGEISCIFPFFDELAEPKVDYFDLEGPFEAAKTIRIPPPGRYEDYELKDDRLFIVLMANQLTEQALRALLAEIEKDVLLGPESVPIKAERLLEWFQERYPETLLRHHPAE